MPSVAFYIFDILWENIPPLSISNKLLIIKLLDRGPNYVNTCNLTYLTDAVWYGIKKRNEIIQCKEYEVKIYLNELIEKNRELKAKEIFLNIKYNMFRNEPDFIKYERYWYVPHGSFFIDLFYWITNAFVFLSLNLFFRLVHDCIINYKMYNKFNAITNISIFICFLIYLKYLIFIFLFIFDQFEVYFALDNIIFNPSFLKFIKIIFTIFFGLLHTSTVYNIFFFMLDNSELVFIFLIKLKNFILKKFLK